MAVLQDGDMQCLTRCSEQQGWANPVLGVGFKLGVWPTRQTTFTKASENPGERGFYLLDRKPGFARPGYSAYAKIYCKNQKDMIVSFVRWIQMISSINGKYMCCRTMPPSSYWPSWKAAMTVRTQKRFSTRWDPLNWYVSRFTLTHTYSHGPNSTCHVSLRWTSWKRRILRFWRARRMTTAWETKSSPEMLDTTFTSWPIRCVGAGNTNTQLYFFWPRARMNALLYREVCCCTSAFLCVCLL